MQGVKKKRVRKEGNPSETGTVPVEKKTGKTRFTMLRYSPNELFIEETGNVGHVCVPRDGTRLNWINVEGTDDFKTLESFGEYYKLHPLILEDILTTDQRPKMEIYHDFICIIVRMMHYDKATKNISYEQVSIILGTDYVITFNANHAGLFKPISDRLKNKADRIRKMGADYLAYAILDYIVDQYFDMLEIFDDRIEQVEVRLVMKPTDDFLKTIHQLKRQVIFMHKSIWPLREVVSALDRGETPLIKDSLIMYLRDLHDHVIQVMDSVDTMRDILSSLLDLYLSSVSKKMNEIMKVLTIISTIFIPLTFLVGVYGMNFHFMPELSMRWAYPVLWIIMITIAGFMVYIFKKKKWL